MKTIHRITLNRPASAEVRVSWKTKDGTARAGVDYLSASGTAVFAGGQTEQSVEVTLLQRPGVSTSRYFDVELSNPSGATISDGSGRCTIEPAIGEQLGPLIRDGLVTNSFHNVQGRGGYFHQNSGTSEGQAVAIESAFLAHEVLAETNPEASEFYRVLGFSMLDAMGDGSATGPMLRQPFPDSADTIALLHWLFAARGDIPGQAIRYDYKGTVKNGKLIVTNHAPDIYRVWSIYPASSALLYENPYSPAFDKQNPGEETQREITSWALKDGRVEIDVPAGVTGEWCVIYGYGNSGIIKQGEAEEAWPMWTKVDDGYAACAPDTFRWFDFAIELAIKHDKRAGVAQKWSKLRDAVRRTAVKGQALTDLREVFKPLPGFPALPRNGEPSGMFCYSDHPAATTPPTGYTQSWSGYNFWSREADGMLLATIPAAPALNVVQLGRGFNDEWRKANSYQRADTHLWVSLSTNNAMSQGHCYVFVSGTKTYDAMTRYYADLTKLPAWSGVANAFAAGGTVDFFVPRSAFLRKDSDSAVLPDGLRIENFGLSIEDKGQTTLRVRNLRLVSAANEEGKNGSKMPYFPGAMPFAINADTIRQQFIGFNGSPFHGYQLPDFWLVLEQHADAVHPGLKASDLPVANIQTGGLEYPILATLPSGTPKPRAALLMEQQLIFLKHAQQRWEIDAGYSGPFAHTFVLNTPARRTIGNPTPHTWVYTNDDPNTRWGGYQARVVESLAKLAWDARFKQGFQVCRDMAAEMALSWLSWLNDHWSSLDGVSVGGVLIKGPPTDFDNPKLKPVETLYEEPHIAAVILRAAVWLKLYQPATTELCDALIQRSWDYLETLWQNDGAMQFTWSPSPDGGEWFGFWHFEIITSLTTLLMHPVRPAGVPEAIVRERLVKTHEWLKNIGVK